MHVPPEHVGHAGVGIVSLRRAPGAMPSSATVAVQSFFWPWSAACGFPGADEDAEKLGLTDQLFAVALCELSCGWGFQCGAHQYPLLVKWDLGWALD